jgi:prepilin-type N-terminal cleavage/methylation domain-containing protein
VLKKCLTPNNKGFTLIEFLVIIFIIGIIGVIASSRMPDISAMRREQAARKIQSDIRYAQSLAVSLQRRTRLIFSTASDNYSIYIENTYGAGNWVLAAEPATRKDFTIQLNSEPFNGVGIETVYFNGDDYGLVFDRWGNPYGYNVSTGATTALTNPARLIITGPVEIRVERGTGRVYIQ